MTPPQDSASDVERLRAALEAVLDAYDDAANYDMLTAQLETAVEQGRAALAVPINKIGEDARTYADGVEDAAKLVELYDTFSGTPCCDAVRDVMAVELAEQVRRLSTSTDKGVR